VVLERFNPATRAVIVIAQDIARKGRSRVIDTDHLLLALTASLGTDSSRALALLGVFEGEVRKRVEGKPGGHRPSPPHIPFSPELKQVIRAGVAWANDHGHVDISSDHLLIGLAYHPQSAGGRILADLGVSSKSARNALAAVAGSGQPGEEVRDAAQVATEYAARRANSARYRQSVGAADASVRSAARVDSSPDRAWALLSSPQVWALSPRGCVMFDVPGPDQLWFLAGEVPGSLGQGPQCPVFEVSMTPARMELKLSARVPERLGFTVSVAAQRRGSSEISVSRTVPVRRGRSGRAAEAKIERELDEWLQVICNVLEGRSSWPGGETPPKLLQTWTTERRIEQPVTKSAAVLIDAELAAVWNVLRSTRKPVIDGWPPQICSGYVPGAPIGAVGEMQYGVLRGARGSPSGFVDVVIQCEDRQSVVTQDIRPWNDRTSCRLSSEAGKTRLEMTKEWPGATVAAYAADNATKLLEHPRKLLDAYKTHIESST
jgi:hypothetical protein